MKDFLKNEIKISDFSPHLFWDAKVENLNLDRNASLVVGRVLEYGRMSDWNLLKTYFGLKRIGEIAQNLKSLDPKSHIFIATFANLPKESFRCYTTRQLSPKHWNF